MMVADFLSYITEKQLFSTSERLLLTVSGGIDSVVLAKLCYDAGLSFGIAHCNFQLRGHESDGDETFVRELACQYGVAFHVQHFDTNDFAEQNGLSIQMAARQLRYEWFEKLRQEHRYDYIATAHHQDDLLETILLNLTRGTGLAGLHGILPKNNFLVRPLLFATRNEIEKFRQEMKLTWREDRSNASNDYLRNRLRHEVVPILREMNPQVAASFATLAERVSATEEIVAESMAEASKEVVQEKQDSIWISFQNIEQLAAPLERLSYWLAKYGFSYHQIKGIWLGRNGLVGKQFFSKTHTLIIDRYHWVISLTKKEADAIFILSFDEGEIAFFDGLLKWQTLDDLNDVTFEANPNEVYLDADELIFPLTLRPWQTGDWFCPFGMNGKRKKISDFLIDAKVPRNLKERVYVLESAGKIVWLVGFRLDNRFRTTTCTKKIKKIIFS